MKKKVDSRIRTLVENGVKTRQRSLFVIVGDKGRDQVWYLCSNFIFGGFPTSVCWNQTNIICVHFFFIHFYTLSCGENECVLVDCKSHSRGNWICWWWPVNDNVSILVIRSSNTWSIKLQYFMDVFHIVFGLGKGYCQYHKAVQMAHSW